MAKPIIKTILKSIKYFLIGLAVVICLAIGACTYYLNEAYKQSDQYKQEQLQQQGR